MQLTLTNGYPMPYPNFSHLDKPGECVSDKLCDDVNQYAGSLTLVLEGVVHFQILHTVTVEFATVEAYDTAKALTGWRKWSDLVLEVPTSSEDGYEAVPAFVCQQEYKLPLDHPTDRNMSIDVVADKVAYCGFHLSP